MFFINNILICFFYSTQNHVLKLCKSDTFLKKDRNFKCTTWT